MTTLTEQNVLDCIAALDRVRVPEHSPGHLLDAALYVQGTPASEPEPPTPSSTGGAPSLSRRYMLRRGLTSQRPWEEQSTSSVRSAPLPRLESRPFYGPGILELLRDGSQMNMHPAQQRLLSDINFGEVEARVSAWLGARRSLQQHHCIQDTMRDMMSSASMSLTAPSLTSNRNDDEEE